MHLYSNEIIENFMVRKSKKQKLKFIDRIKEMLGSEGYQVTIEKGGMFQNRNIVIGDINTAKVIFTAHYDTCAVCPFPNFITPRNILFYIIYQIILVVAILGFSNLVGWIFWFVTKSDMVAILVSLVTALLICIQIMAGFPNKNTYNDNTSGVITLLEIAMNLPENDRKNVAFVFFDNEEMGLLGSSSFKAKHKKILKDKLIINFDCVSDGDHLLVVVNKKARKDELTFPNLESSFISTEEKHVRYVPAITTFYPSDQILFKKNIAVSSMHKIPIIGYYMGRIHTPFDTKFDERNISLISESMLRFIANIPN